MVLNDKPTVFINLVLKRRISVCYDIWPWLLPWTVLWATRKAVTDWLVYVSLVHCQHWVHIPSSFSQVKPLLVAGLTFMKYLPTDACHDNIDIGIIEQPRHTLRYRIFSANISLLAFTVHNRPSIIHYSHEALIKLGRGKMAAIYSRHLQMHFHEWKVLYLYSDVPWVCS